MNGGTNGPMEASARSSPKQHISGISTGAEETRRLQDARNAVCVSFEWLAVHTGPDRRNGLTYRDTPNSIQNRDQVVEWRRIRTGARFAPVNAHGTAD